LPAPKTFRAMLANPSASSAHLWLQRGLLAVGIALLLFYAIVTANTWRFQRQAKADVQQMVSIERPPAMTEKLPDVSKPLANGELIGRVDIPRLKLSAAVAEGDDDRTLGKAVGHLPDTPLPWQRRGNVGLAAHRDGLFRRLENIRMNDDVRIVTPRGEYHYRVTKTHIVDPEDVWVLAPTLNPTLTLITCYPFSFVGNAPQRFIVQAELVGQLAGSALRGSIVR
jgi:sortase A